MKIKFHDIYKGLSNKNEIEKKIISLIRSNSFIGGKPVDEFEKKFAKFTKSNYCISVGNGTDALEIALEALKVKKGSDHKAVVVRVKYEIHRDDGSKVKFDNNAAVLVDD